MRVRSPIHVVLDVIFRAESVGDETKAAFVVFY